MSFNLETPPVPFGLSLFFDKLRMIGNTHTLNTHPIPFGLSLSFDKLRMIGNTHTLNTHPVPFGLSLSKACAGLRQAQSERRQ